MEKSILVIQFRTDDSKKHEQVCIPDKFVRHERDRVRLHFISAFEDVHVWDDPQKLLNGFDGVILGGSSEFYFGGNPTPEKEEMHQFMLQRVQPFVRYLLEYDIPTLGICFGHQMLGYFLGAEVVNDPHQAESGSFQVCLADDGKRDVLFRDIPDDFISFFIHRDSLAHLPNECVLLARGPKCKVAAFRYKKKIYGLQFHPELEKKDVAARMYEHPEYVGGSVEDFLDSLLPTHLATKILMNFYDIL